MRKKIKVLMLTCMMFLIGYSAKEEEIHSYVNITNDGRLVTAYRDGKDITDKRVAYEMLVEESISSFLNRDRNELEFSLFCMLEEDGCTVDVMVDNLAYTFTCSMAGDIVSVSRADGEKFGIR